MKRPVLLTSLCGTLVILGYAGARHEANAELKRGISNFYAHLPPGVTFTYKKAYPRILFRGAAFTQVKISDAHVTFTTDHLLINAPSGAPRTGLHFKLMTAIRPHFELQQRAAASWMQIRAEADGLRLRDVTLPPIDADDHHPVDIKTLIATRLGQLTTDHLHGRAVTDQGGGPDGVVAATSARHSVTFKAAWLDIRGINHAVSTITEARNIRITSLRGLPPPDGTPSHEVAEVEIAYLRNVAFDAPDEIRKMLGLPTSDLTALCPTLTGRSSFGKLVFSQGNFRGHINPFHFETTLDGNIFRTVASPVQIKIDVGLNRFFLPIYLTSLSMSYQMTCNRRTQVLDTHFNLTVPYFATLNLGGTISMHSPTTSKIPSYWLMDAYIAYRDLGLIKYGLGTTAEKSTISPAFLRGLYSQYTSRPVRETPGWAKLSDFLSHHDDRTLQLIFSPANPVELDLTPDRSVKFDKFLRPSDWTVTTTP
ncbi:MAG: hypothetical protein AAYR33_10505 [Acetobacteraceae bacterium]